MAMDGVPTNFWPANVGNSLIHNGMLNYILYYDRKSEGGRNRGSRWTSKAEMDHA